MSRNSAPFSYYLRTATKRLGSRKNHNNVLAASAAGEAMFMYMFVKWADADRTTYQ